MALQIKGPSKPGNKPFTGTANARTIEPAAGRDELEEGRLRAILELEGFR